MTLFNMQTMVDRCSFLNAIIMQSEEENACRSRPSDTTAHDRTSCLTGQALVRFIEYQPRFPSLAVCVFIGKDKDRNGQRFLDHVLSSFQRWLVMVEDGF